MKGGTDERFDGTTDGLGQTSSGERPEPKVGYRPVVTGSQMNEGEEVREDTA